MKSMFKTLIVGVVAFLAINASAVTYFQTNLAANGIHGLLPSGKNIKGFKFFSSSPTTLHFYDQKTTTAPEYGTNIVVEAYTNWSQYATSIVSTVIGMSGYTNSITNNYIYTVGAAVAKATNQLAKVYSVVLPASTFYETPEDFNILTMRGLTALGVVCTNVSLTIMYDSP